VTLRPEVLRERLAFVRRNLSLLRPVAEIPPGAFLADLKEQWAAAYGLQVSVQALLDAGAHLLTSHFAEAPRDYGDIVTLLARRGVLPPALAARLGGIAGFRNILVHEYAVVDFSLVHGHLQRLDDLFDFGAALEGWLSAAGL